MRLVAQAQTSRSRAQLLADRAAFLLTLAAIGAAVVTLLAWAAAGAVLMSLCTINGAINAQLLRPRRMA